MKLIVHLKFTMGIKMIYANTASIGRLSETTREEVSNFVNAYLKNDFYIDDYKIANEKKEQCRQIISQLFGNTFSSVLFFSSTTDALSILLSQLKLKKGSVIALPNNYFPSIEAIKLSFEKKNYELIEIGSSKGEINVDDLKNKKIDFLLIEWVNYWSGSKNNLKKLSQWCLKNNVIFAVDAVQGVGCCEIDFDIHEIDFFISAGHKWLRALEGSAFAIVSQRVSAYLEQIIYGYNSFSDKNNFDKKGREIETSLLRFELGTLSTVSFVSLFHAISELLENDHLKIAKKIRENSFALTDFLLGYGAIVHSPFNERDCTGIVSFTLPNIEPLEIYNRLLEFGVITKVRNDRIRVSPDITVDINELIQRIGLCLKGFL
ncbi:aminotransferase class V-fold PLP-dependent enzyme [Fluviispira multicolorata]|uniref:Aminotransferase class V-fold PLP-dependent enzyme n=1 Tax=Fluviispira multicolorata TaxID=2654512 RepID=A0A833JBX0_9BACT|nr:aminotransferase class V-fold PLP-dependent enzyme [Fluviispira multicolorata]KAB8028574.1 aminotransferase class V-fold PLP-dependent enzyme [Fluviispira multicolorata]